MPVTKPPVVLMVGPLPSGPIVGGIANGIRMLLESRVARETSMQLFNTYRRPDARRAALRRIAFQLGAAWRFVWTVLTTRPTIVHVKAASYVNFYQSALYAALARALGRSVILQLHAGDFPEFYASAGSARQRIIRAALRMPHRLMALSDAWAEYFRGLAGSAAITVVPNALDTSAYRDAAADRGAFGIPADRSAVLFVGTCNEHADAAKGLPELAAAVALVRVAHPEILLVAAGVENGARVLEPVLGTSGTGWMDVGVIAGDRKPALYRSVDVFALPSRFENMPNTLLEAMAAGLPSVATDVGAVAEMVVDGESGYVVRVGDGDALATRLGELAADRALRTRLGLRAARLAAERFDIALLETRLLAEYALLGGGSADQALLIQNAKP